MKGFITMSDYAIDVSVADFDEKVLAASHKQPVIVDFWAPWCQPCRILKPILEKLAAEYAGKFLLAKVNSDENQELAMRYGVRGIPAVKAFVEGELVDEFTGALPEGEVRAFLDRLIPSPAEPIRLEALRLAAQGELAAARQKLSEAIALDPGHEAAILDFVELSLALGELDVAEARLAAIADRARDRNRVDALKARLALAQQAGDADVATLQARVAENGGDLEARHKLAHALALQQDYRGALEHLLEIVRRDRKWQDEAGRKGMLNLFTLLGDDPQYDDLVREFRVALARTLN
ncbi:MAG: tetratricopeptide repeat protein [Rhodocyclaceae bacterium]|nr:tetratricopeptide repeat protein [Rhodocyclaceae bacterium]